MALRIRLKRIGMKKKPVYRIVVAESSLPRDGAVVEEIGMYDPVSIPPVLSVKTDRADFWVKNGAQPSDTVRALIKKAKATE